jgi:hypothetical protein
MLVGVVSGMRMSRTRRAAASASLSTLSENIA